MALPTPKFPGAEWDGNEQDTTNDGPADTAVAQAADYNAAAAEVVAIEQKLRRGALRAFWNDTGAALNPGQLVRVVGYDAASGLPTVIKAQASASSSLAQYLVLVTTADAAAGLIGAHHAVNTLDTSSFSAGASVFLSPTTAGGITTTAPSAPDYAQFVGKVTRVHATAGEVEFSVGRPPIPDNVGIEFTGERLRLKDGGVSAARLADGVADLVPKLAAITQEAEGTPGADDIRFTIQVQDAQGNSLAARCVLDVWVSTTDFGAPGGTQTVSVDTGTLLAAITADQYLRVMTDATGAAKVVVNVSGAGTRYLMAGLPADVRSASATWA